MDLVLFGIQGSGKGTQAKKIAQLFGFEVFEAGGELRRIAATGTELGNTVKSFIDVGKLVPHAIIMRVVEEAVRHRRPGEPILFDGVPRDLEQMRDFDRIMGEHKRDFRCLHLVIDPEEGVQRILKRSTIEGRADDASEAAIRERMQLFDKRTRPVIEYYRSRGKLMDVEGEGTVEEIFQSIVRVLQAEGFSDASRLH
jgi:adenylate kinase